MMDLANYFWCGAISDGYFMNRFRPAASSAIRSHRCISKDGNEAVIMVYEKYFNNNNNTSEHLA